MLAEVFDWINNSAPDGFDDDFIISLDDQFLKRGTLSDKQYQALKNIWSKWVNRQDDNYRDEYAGGLDPEFYK